MLQFITHTNTRFQSESAGAAEALRGGCRWIQLRMKHASEEQIIAEGLQLRELCDSFGATLILDEIIGATANSFADIQAAASAGADYIGLGPFRFTTTKENLSTILGVEGYSTIMQQCRKAGITIPVVAIGGITPDDIAALRETGVNGVAVSGAILNAEDPAAETARFIF